MDEILEILTKYHTIAIVGASPDPSHDSYGVVEYMKNKGYRIIPVNPNAAEVLGQTAYPDLLSIPAPVEVVNIFRRPVEVGPVVEQAIAIGASAIWMQLGIINKEAAGRARAAGLKVVMDRCMKVEHYRWLGRGR